jgi:hypothetical protein
LASGMRLFGSWDAALRAAGLDPTLIRRHKIWTDQCVLDEIRRRASAELPLNFCALTRDWNSLAAMGIIRFGSWNDALRRAGFDPELVRRMRRPWTRSQIIAQIRARYDQRLPLTPSRVRPVSLVGASQRLFGTWKGALRAAGLRPEQVYRRLPWTRERFVNVVRLELARGVRQCDWQQYCVQTLRNQATRLFGSWRAAMNASCSKRTQE